MQRRKETKESINNFPKLWVHFDVTAQEMKSLLIIAFYAQVPFPQVDNGTHYEDIPFESR
jgi:hypothetical protein